LATHREGLAQNKHDFHVLVPHTGRFGLARCRSIIVSKELVSLNEFKPYIQTINLVLCKIKMNESAWNGSRCWILERLFGMQTTVWVSVTYLSQGGRS
jgi:hypothetical protein